MAALTEAKIKSTLTRHAKARRTYGQTTFLIGADGDGQLWYTNSYYAAKVEAKGAGIGRPVAVQYLGAYNLTPVSGVYPVNGSVSAPNGDGPNIGGLIPAADVWIEAGPIKVAGRPALVRVGEVLARVFAACQTLITVDDDYASWVELTAGVVTWKAQRREGLASADKPLGGFNETGELVAMVMPIRLS